jgi:hypothetical protein
MDYRKELHTLAEFSLLLLEMYYKSEHGLIPYTKWNTENAQKKLKEEVSIMREKLQEIVKRTA